MAKTKSKSRRSKSRISKANPRSYSQMYSGDTQQPEQTAPTAAKTVAPEPREDDAVDWSSEYGYVLRDLRTLLVVSFVIFAVMIGAGLFI